MSQGPHGGVVVIHHMPGYDAPTKEIARTLDAVVDCYGAFVVGTPPEGMPLKAGPIKHLIKDLSCPLLGLFGADDRYPSPEQVDEL